MRYAMNVDLTGRSCLVVGGGAVALRKVQTLLRAAADVTVVAPSCVDALRRLALAGEIHLLVRGFAPEDLAGRFLCICATDDAAVNRQAARIAKARGVLVNAAAEPQLSDFTVPASLARGRLHLTVSTEGLSPALSRAIRAQLEEIYPESFGAWLEILAGLREEQKAQLPTPAARTAFWRRALDADVLALVRAGRLGEAKEKVSHAAHLSRTQS